MDDRTVRGGAQSAIGMLRDAGDFKAEHEIYREDAVLDYPQSGERIRGRAQHSGEPLRPDPTRSVLRSGELSAAAISGSLNSYVTYDGMTDLTR